MGKPYWAFLQETTELSYKLICILRQKRVILYGSWVLKAKGLTMKKTIKNEKLSNSQHKQRRNGGVAVKPKAQRAALKPGSTRALNNTELRYQSLFDNMLNGLAYCKMFFEQGQPVDFVYLGVNRAFESLTGLKNVAGKKVSEVIPGIRDTDPDLFEIYGRVSLTGQSRAV